jgi:hypothetical protein
MMTGASLTAQGSTVESADALEANELYQRNGWTDGLPIVPPTDERVRECLEWVGLPGDHVIGVETVRRRPLTAEKVAINAVMAGCLAAHFPVVVAAVEAMCDEAFLLHGCSASTGGSAPLVIVNGPIRRELDMNATHNVLANGNRANASIGRALRLVLVNLLGCVPGELDRSTLGHPGKYTLCVAEDEEDSTWLPLAAERGAAPGVSAVTVFACESPLLVMNEWTREPEEILETFAAAMRANMLQYSIWSGNYAIVIAKQLRDLIAAAGWDKRAIREFVHARARVSRRDWEAVGKAALVRDRDPDQEFTALGSPDDLLVVAAGGPAGGFGAVFPPWYGNRSRAVTKGIGVCVNC